ncbi:hypothetical protein AHF37_07193 [Paragonimus kellicotti]|nr:hypothetical protein AHF37_07193 [Paragonimus kellicotti]
MCNRVYAMSFRVVFDAQLQTRTAESGYSHSAGLTVDNKKANHQYCCALQLYTPFSLDLCMANRIMYNRIPSAM